ncbi:MAG: SDR family oxidoreductase [Acidobacteria bacterium]|nr:SDR family oxidoreductase [Acidobacteriota bacterium]
MKILIIGGSGMLGHKLVQIFKEKFDVWTTIKSDFNKYKKFGILDKKKTIENLNVEDLKSVEKVINKIRPDVIINAVGIIKQIQTSQDVVKTLTINSIFPHNLAIIAEKNQARLINISTDCVFNGKKGNYEETDLSDAVDLYGKSKNLGEVEGKNCLTLRTSIIGRELKTSHSLVEWFLSNQGKKVKGFTNAVYSGFPTIVFADILADLLVNHKNLDGIYHLSSQPINKFELLKLIKSAYKADIEIEPFAEFKIDRSLDSTKLRRKIGFEPISWKKMIEVMANDPTPYKDWKK